MIPAYLCIDYVPMGTDISSSYVFQKDIKIKNAGEYSVKASNQGPGDIVVCLTSIRFSIYSRNRKVIKPNFS